MSLDVRYRSTRNNGKILKASQAIIQGLSEDGGLFVPDLFPRLEVSPSELAKMDYKEVAYEVMKLFFTDFTEEELKYCIEHAYDSKFDTEEIAPLTYVDGTYYLELFHGKTIAFKDMALSILPYLMTTSAKKNDVREKIIILTATSGDTGKAALAGFADVEGCGIVVFYPKGGVSKVQERQMVTQKGKNVKVVGIHGNFDDAQTGVKKIFSDEEGKNEIENNSWIIPAHHVLTHHDTKDATCTESGNYESFRACHTCIAEHVVWLAQIKRQNKTTLLIKWLIK